MRRAKNPAGLTYGSAGVGSILHTTVELMANETKTKYLHVPYRGEAPAITGLLQGDIDFIAATSGPISARIRSGEFRALAVTGKLAGATSPTCPPWRKRAFPEFEVISWTGLTGPAKLPKPIVEKLNGEVRRAIAVPEVKSKLEGMGGDPRATTPGEMRALVASQLATSGQARQGSQHLDRLGGGSMRAALGVAGASAAWCACIEPSPAAAMAEAIQWSVAIAIEFPPQAVMIVSSGASPIHHRAVC